MIDEMKQGKDVVITPWGRAKIGYHNYYLITSRKEGNQSKTVHKLIWEAFYGKKSHEDYDIHHIDGNKLNNSIHNLQCVEHGKHKSFHNKQNHHDVSGDNNPRAKYGKLWDIRYVQYVEAFMFENGRTPNPCKSFKLKYNGKYVNIGGFHDFVTVEIINDLIREMIE